MLNHDQVKTLRAPFPEEALSVDTSRGFELTSIKAAFVIERLNEVFGPCGIGWRYVHGPFEELQSDNGRVEVVTEVAFQYRYHATNGYTGTDPVLWDAQSSDWVFRDHGPNHDWSEPVFACGGNTVGKGGAPVTDARKSAVTDGLTKAASMVGVGHEVFKGLVRVGDGNGRWEARKADRGGNGANATAFWSLYNDQAKPAGVPIEVARGIAGNGDWAQACADLRTLIAGAKT